MKQMLLALAAVIGLGSTAGAVTKAAVIDNLSRNVVMKTYADLGRSAQALKDAVEAFAANPTQERLNAAQQAWLAARQDYEVSEGFLFGPMDSLGIDPNIDTWPLALKDLKAILASDHELTLDFVRSLGSNVLGFHSIEYILFGEGVVTNTKELSLFTEREKRYAVAAATLLNEQIELLLFAWTKQHDPEDASSPSYFDVISKPGAGNDLYGSETAVIQEFVNGIITIIGEAGDGKLPDPTGSDPDEANASLEESPFSWNSINDFTANADSVLNIYTGSYRGQNYGPGIKDLVASQDPALADRVEREIIAARGLIQAIPGPEGISFGRAIRTTEGRVRIFAAIQGLATLRRTLENEVTPLFAE